MKIPSLSKSLALTALLSTSLFANSAEFSNGYVFGDSLSDNGNLRALLNDPTVPERNTNGPLAAEIVAAHLGHTLTPSLHLIPDAPRGNNYSIATAKTRDEDGNEYTPDINLPTQVNAYLLDKQGIAEGTALHSFIIGAGDILEALEIRAAGAIEESRDVRKQARLHAKELISEAVASEEAQIRKLIAAGAEHVLVVNATDVGALPITDIITATATAQTETPSQLSRTERLPKIATRLSVKFNKLLARKINKIERETGIDIIEIDLFASTTSQIDNAEELGYTNTDTPCIYILQSGLVNPECTDFPVASGFLFWDEYHPTTTAHSITAQETIETIQTH